MPGTALSHVGPTVWPEGTSLPRSGTLPALLEEMAATSPHAPALLVNGSESSYAELSRRVGQAAAAFSRLEVGPGTQTCKADKAS